MDTPETTPPDESADARKPLVYTETRIELEAAALPEPLRESFRWLKSFCRDACNKSVALLHERFRAVGVYHDTTTWVKILKGRMFKDPSGNPLKQPILAQEKFLQAVEALRNNVRAEALRGKIPFVETSVWQDIYDYVQLKMGRDRVNKFGIIVGPTGASKTASFKEVVRRINHGTTRWFEAPENGSLSELMSRMAVSFGSSAQTSLDKKRTKIHESVKDHHLLIIDNCQDLYRPGKIEQPALSFLRRLQDETGCTIILSITPTFEKALMDGMIAGYFEQFEGRSGGRNKWLRLPEFPPDEDVLKIAKAFELQHAEKHLQELVAIAHEPGRIRRLFEDLQEGKRLATAAKAKFTIEHVRDGRGGDEE